MTNPPVEPVVYSVDDRIINTARPEWGAGVVIRAKAQNQGGVRCQMLSVRFDRTGMKQLSTAMAPLRFADGTGARSTTTTATPDKAPAAEPGASLTLSDLSQLPPDATNPTRSANARLKTVLSEFKRVESRTSEAVAPHASRSARSPAPDQRLLLDWAISRSGLSDPLSRFNRTELEAAYDTFVRRLHDQLRPLIKAAASEDLAEFARVVEAAPAVGRDAAKRALPATHSTR